MGGREGNVHKTEKEIFTRQRRKCSQDREGNIHTTEKEIVTRQRRKYSYGREGNSHKTEKEIFTRISSQDREVNSKTEK